MASNIIDELFVKLSIDSKELAKQSKEVNKTLNKIKEEAEKTGEAVDNSFSGKSSKKKNKGKSKPPLKEFNEDLQKSVKNVDALGGSVSKLSKIFGGMLDIISSPYASPLAGVGVAAAISEWGKNIANANTPFFFDAQRLNTPVNQLYGLGRAITKIGGGQGDINSALGVITGVQTGARTGDPAVIGALKYLSHYGVNIAKNNKARNPLDVLLDLGDVLKKNVSLGKMLSSDAYNVFSQVGVGQNAASFFLQGSKAVRGELAKEMRSGGLNDDYVKNMKKITEASADAATAINNLKIEIVSKLTPFIVGFFKSESDFFNFLSGGSKFRRKFIRDQTNAANKLSPNLNILHKNFMGWLTHGESGLDPTMSYNAYNTGTQGTGFIGHSGFNQDVSKMNIAQIMKWQQDTSSMSSLNPLRLFAVGRYQFTPQTLAWLVKRFHIDKNRMFDKKTQDELGMDLLSTTAAGSYIAGKSNNLQAAIAALRNTWTSLRGESDNQIIGELRMARSQYMQAHSNVKHARNNNPQTHTNTTSIGDIHVHTQATEANGIAQDIKHAIKNHLSYVMPIQANTWAT